MKTKRILFVALFSLLLLSSFAVAKPKVEAETCPINYDTNVVFYGETGFGGVGDISRSWIIHFLDWWKVQDSSIKYVELSADDVTDNCDLADYPNVKVYVQPGGNAYYQQRKLGTEGKDAITEYINSGRGYLGICAGFFYVAGDYYWQDSYYDHANLLGLYPTLEGSITDIADYDDNPGYALTPLSNGFNAIYYGGPTTGYVNTPNHYLGEAEATYLAVPDSPAIVTYDNMLLTSVHLEAFENDDITGLSTDDRVENYKLLANLLNKVSGTNFVVPAYAEDEPEEPVNDTNETGNFSEFVEGFESGNLLSWNLYGPGAAWTASTDVVFEGNYAARAKKTGVSDNSYMEAEIESCDGDKVLEYHRQLVGLDIADDFEVSYYDGSWNSLEHIGTGTGRDSSFKYRSYPIPNDATKIRFMCEAGAVSEKCYVDNVKVTCN